MKKMLLLLVGVLLIACMASSAMAGTVVDEKLIQTGTSNDVVVVSPNSQTTVSVDLRADYKYIFPNTGTKKVTISVSSPGFQITIPAEGKFSSFTLDQRTVSYNDPFEGYVSLPENAIRVLQVKNTGATGPSTLTVTVGDSFHCS